MTNERKVRLNTWRLREHAAAAGVSIYKLAELLEICPATMSYRNRTGWSLSDAQKLAGVLGVSLTTIWLDDPEQRVFTSVRKQRKRRRGSKSKTETKTETETENDERITARRAVQNLGITAR